MGTLGLKSIAWQDSWTSNHPEVHSKTLRLEATCNCRIFVCSSNSIRATSWPRKQIAGWWANPHCWGGLLRFYLICIKKCVLSLNVFESPWMKHSSMSQDSGGSYVVTCDLTGIQWWLVTIRQSNCVLSMQRGQLRECFINWVISCQGNAILQARCDNRWWKLRTLSIANNFESFLRLVVLVTVLVEEMPKILKMKPRVAEVSGWVSWSKQPPWVVLRDKDLHG